MTSIIRDEVTRSENPNEAILAGECYCRGGLRFAKLSCGLNRLADVATRLRSG
jgi:hypothetical protein